MLLHARAGSDQELLNCIVTKPGEEKKEYQFRNVSLIQKDKHDYLYITCKVREQTHNNKAVIMSMEVIKACWFTRRSRGSVTWLQQKYSYETAS